MQCQPIPPRPHSGRVLSKCCDMNSNRQGIPNILVGVVPIVTEQTEGTWLDVREKEDSKKAQAQTGSQGGAAVHRPQDDTERHEVGHIGAA